jgi:hypothetical protein
MEQRKIVMGRRHGQDGIVCDEIVAPVRLGEGGVATWPIWGGDEPGIVPSDGQAQAETPGFPPAGGFRYSVLTIPAGANGPYRGFIDTALGSYAVEGQSGMHWTPTIDCIVVTAGELVLEGDSDSVTVRAGDSIIINGNRHRWNNNGAQDAVIHAISLGARVSE